MAVKKNLNLAGRSRRTAKLKYVSITIIGKLGCLPQKKLQRSVGLNLGWNYADNSSARLLAGVLTLWCRPATDSTC